MPPQLILICAGTREEPAYEDVLCAGALCDLLWSEWCAHDASDSALIARKLFLLENDNLVAAVSESRNCRRLLSIPELKGDVPYCLQRDLLRTVIEMDKEGTVTQVSKHG
jgi:2-phosphosulfolactate phosphatase